MRIIEPAFAFEHKINKGRLGEKISRVTTLLSTRRMRIIGNIFILAKLFFDSYIEPHLFFDLA